MFGVLGALVHSLLGALLDLVSRLLGGLLVE